MVWAMTAPQELKKIPIIGDPANAPPAMPPMRVPGGAHGRSSEETAVSKAVEAHGRAVAQQIVGAYTVLLSEIISGLADRDLELAGAVARKLADARHRMSGPDAPDEVRFVFDALLQMLPVRDARFRPNQS